MKIVNNKISLARGETAPYDVSVVNRETGVPYMLQKGINNPVIEFVVRPSVYSKEDDFVFKAYLFRTNDHLFETNEYVDYEYDLWIDDYAPSEKDKGKLFKRTVIINSNKKEIDFRYYDENQVNEEDGTHWIPYEFRINFTFPYEATSLMEAKTYLYEVTLFGGVLEDDVKDKLSPPEDGRSVFKKIDYKEPLLEATDFIVGGSLSE